MNIIDIFKNMLPGDIRKDTRISEKCEAKIIHKLYSLLGLSADIPLEMFKTNCNTHFLNKMDTSNTSGKVCCIPLEVLEKIIPHDKVENEDSISCKKRLFNIFYNKYKTIKDIVKLDPRLIIYYKPIGSSTIVNHSESNEYMEHYAKIIPSIEEKKTVDIYDYRSNRRDDWMSDKELRNIIGPLTFRTNVTYRGIQSLDVLHNMKANRIEYIFNDSYSKKRLIEIFNTPKSTRFMTYIYLYNNH